MRRLVYDCFVADVKVGTIETLAEMEHKPWFSYKARLEEIDPNPMTEDRIKRRDARIAARKRFKK